MKLTPAILLIAVSAAQTPAFAGDTARSDWANVTRLAIGDDIRVSTTDGKAFRGQLQSSTPDSLIMIAANSQQTIARAQVLKVATKGKNHRARNTLIGAGVGAGAGLAIGAAGDHSCSNDCFLGKDFLKETVTPIGAVIGAIVGLTWPTGHWHDVYRAK